MSIQPNFRHCKECGAPLKGRIDQKFCADFCRNQFHNRINWQHRMATKSINRILQNNHSVLRTFLCQHKKRKISSSEMLLMGFDFQYYTHVKKNRRGQVYQFCYDFGYLRIDEVYVYIVHQDNASTQ